MTTNQPKPTGEVLSADLREVNRARELLEHEVQELHDAAAAVLGALDDGRLKLARGYPVVGENSLLELRETCNAYSKVSPMLDGDGLDTPGEK